MPRSAILSGLPVPRDRAQQRGRLDKARSQRTIEPSASEPIGGYCTSRFGNDLHIEKLERLDLTTFIRDTAHLDLPVGERLRQLAIWLEEDLLIETCAKPPRPFLVLERIYEHAERLDPESACIPRSRAAAAMGFASFSDDEHTPHYEKCADRALERALRLDPEDAHVYYLFGNRFYFDDKGGAKAALPWYEQACARDPGHAWAKLYRAHCLHDLARWAEAAAAYARVDGSAFTGPSAWRYDKLREQRAYCLLEAGFREGALAEFTIALARYEHLSVERALDIHELIEVARGKLREPLYERVRALVLRRGLTHEIAEIDANPSK